MHGLSSDVDPNEALDRPAADVSRPVASTAALLFTLTVASQLIALAFGRVDQEESLRSILLPSLLFQSVLTLPSVLLGLTLGRQIGLGAPLITAILSGSAVVPKIDTRRDAVGRPRLALGLFLLLLRVVSAAELSPEIPPLGYRGVAGGLAVSIGAAVAEEVWFRLGLMTILIWCLCKVLGLGEVRSSVAWSAILVTSIVFGLAHLPQLNAYGAASRWAIGATIAGNCAAGLLYGWCYWRRSLIAAMIAHFAVDLALHVLPALAH